MKGFPFSANLQVLYDLNNRLGSDSFITCQGFLMTIRTVRENGHAKCQREASEYVAKNLSQ